MVSKQYYKVHNIRPQFYITCTGNGVEGNTLGQVPTELTVPHLPICCPFVLERLSGKLTGHTMLTSLPYRRAFRNSFTAIHIQGFTYELQRVPRKLHRMLVA
jgi:hypothetical protein